jgi:hypothetical protein
MRQALHLDETVADLQLGDASEPAEGSGVVRGHEKVPKGNKMKMLIKPLRRAMVVFPCRRADVRRGHDKSTCTGLIGGVAAAVAAGVSEVGAARP